MNGYKPGTRCVITWQRGGRSVGWGLGIGDLVTVGNRVEPDSVSGLLSQDIDRADIKRGHEFLRCFTPAWPISWMRPLEDPDPETIDVEDEVTA